MRNRSQDFQFVTVSAHISSHVGHTKKVPEEPEMAVNVGEERSRAGV